MSTGNVCDDSQAKRESQIVKQAAAQETLVSQLRETIMRLDKRLEPILQQPLPEVESKPEKDRESFAPLAEELWRHNNVLRGCYANLSSIIDRLEL